MRKGILVGIIIFVAAVALVVAAPQPVYAQACNDCADINSSADCDKCGGKLFCTCPCGVLCEKPNNCACEATLCQTSPNCIACGTDAYGACLTCFWCGGTPENCAFDCPDWMPTCITECDGGNGGNGGGGGPIPTPTPPGATPPPACLAPGGLTGADSCDGGDGLIDITWTWGAVAGTTDYLINIDNNSDFSSPELSIFTSSTSYTAVNLAAGTWYARVRVISSDASCSSPSSWSATASATNACTACAAPVNNAPSSACVDQTTYDITWNFSESAGADQYQFVVSTCSGAGFFGCVVYDSLYQSPAFFSCGAGSCSLPMIGFTSGTTYYSRVRAQGAACPTSAWSNEQSAVEFCEVSCPAPGSFTASDSICDITDTLIDITWTWGVVTGATSYRLQVDAAPADWLGLAYNLVLTPGVNVTCIGGTCSYTTIDLTPGTWWGRVHVETDDGIVCTVDPLEWSPAASITDACLTPIVGQIFDDPGGDALIIGGMCTLGGVPGVRPGTGSSVTVNPGGYTDSGIDLSGNFTVPGVPPGVGYTMTLAPDVPSVCTCPSGCAYSVAAPQTGPTWDYFVSQLRESWFQTVGGDVHVEGNIISSIPDSCAPDPACTAEFSLAGTDEEGVVSVSLGLGNYGAGSVSSPGWEATSGYSGPQYLFSFWRKETDPPDPLPDLDGRPSPPSGIYEITSSSDLTLIGNWNNLPGSLTIFVNFSDPALTLTLNPDAPGITINPSGMLTLITNGNVTVADPVTKIEGIYLVDGVFRTCVTDDCGDSAADQLQVLGSVIAWSGLDLQRDLFLDNRNTPGELFTYEPEFLERLPEFILRAIYTWKEVAP